MTVDPQTTYQQYDGTGCSEAFQRSLLIHNLADDARTEVLDYLFTEKGAGLTILRNGIGSTPNQPFDYMKSIAPKAPASNDSEVWETTNDRVELKRHVVRARLTRVPAQLHPSSQKRSISSLAFEGGESARSELHLC